MSVANVRIVLTRPRGAANVGATARAMKNMGLRDLVLVQPARVRSFWAKAMAVHAADVLERLRCSPSLEAAVADCALVVGTTCRQGPYRAAAEPPRAVAPRLLAAARSRPVALVFGPENHGLSNDDLKACHRLISIPTAPEYPSLNLAQAVLVCCYELFLAAAVAAPAGDGARGSGQEPAAARAVALMFRRLQDALLAVGFLRPENPDHIMYAFRRMLGQAQPTQREVRILLGMARQIEWYGRGGWRTMAARRRPVAGGVSRGRAATAGR